MREIEIKLKVKDIEGLEQKLEKAGCKFSKPIRQHDVIYLSKTSSDEFGKAREGHIAMRIRHEDNVSKITLKQQRSHEMDNIEYETEVKDPKEIHNILLTLGWNPGVEVKKIRKKAKMGDYEICLDRVERLGNYIELEKITHENDDPDKVKKELFEAIKPFGLSERDEENLGYDTLIYKLEHKS